MARAARQPEPHGGARPNPGAPRRDDVLPLSAPLERPAWLEQFLRQRAASGAEARAARVPGSVAPRARRAPTDPRAAASEETVLLATAIPGSLVCPRCGEANLRGARSCRQCGLPLAARKPTRRESGGLDGTATTGEPALPIVASRARRAGRPLILAAVALALALMLLVLAAEVFAPFNDTLAAAMGLDIRAGFGILFEALLSLLPR